MADTELSTGLSQPLVDFLTTTLERDEVMGPILPKLDALCGIADLICQIPIPELTDPQRQNLYENYFTPKKVQSLKAMVSHDPDSYLGLSKKFRRQLLGITVDDNDLLSFSDKHTASKLWYRMGWKILREVLTEARDKGILQPYQGGFLETAVKGADWPGSVDVLDVVGEDVYIKDGKFMFTRAVYRYSQHLLAQSITNGKVQKEHQDGISNALLDMAKVFEYLNVPYTIPLPSQTP